MCPKDDQVPSSTLVFLLLLNIRLRPQAADGVGGWEVRPCARGREWPLPGQVPHGSESLAGGQRDVETGGSCCAPLTPSCLADGITARAEPLSAASAPFLAFCVFPVGQDSQNPGCRFFVPFFFLDVESCLLSMSWGRGWRERKPPREWWFHNHQQILVWSSKWLIRGSEQIVVTYTAFARPCVTNCVIPQRHERCAVVNSFPCFPSGRLSRWIPVRTSWGRRDNPTS